MKRRIDFLISILGPSWRFFETSGWLPQLWMRVEESSPSSWTRVLQAPERSLASLFFNPRGNLHLAAQSLVEALVQDLNDLPSDSREGAASLEQSLSYQRVKALVRERAEGKAFQFKITAENEDLLISPLYPGGKPAGAK